MARLLLKISRMPSNLPYLFVVSLCPGSFTWGLPQLSTFAINYIVLVRWPEIEKAIKECCKSWNTCAVTAPAPPEISRHGQYPAIHRIDLAIPFWEACACRQWTHISKWANVIRLANYPTTEITIAGLDALFTSWVLPKTLASDNGPQFMSTEFAD